MHNICNTRSFLFIALGQQDYQTISTWSQDLRIHRKRNITFGILVKGSRSISPMERSRASRTNPQSTFFQRFHYHIKQYCQSPEEYRRSTTLSVDGKA